MPNLGIDALNMYIVVSLACWGIWGIFDKKALENASYTDVILRYSAICVVSIPLVFVVLNTAEPGWHIHPATWGWTCLGALFSTVAVMTYMAALSKTEASFVLGITAAYPMLLQFLAVPMLGEKLVVDRLLGAACIAAGVSAIGFSPTKSAPLPEGKERYKLFALMAVTTLTWGIWGIFDKKALDTATPLEAYFCERVWEIGVLVAVYLWCLCRKIPISWTEKKSWMYIFMSWLALALGRWTYLSALLISSASYVITITGCYPLLMYFFAIAFLREKFNRMRFFGIILVVLGGVLVQVTRDVK